MRTERGPWTPERKRAYDRAYQRQRYVAKGPRQRQTCVLCGEPHKARRLCSRHYQAWREKRAAMERLQEQREA